VGVPPPERVNKMNIRTEVHIKGGVARPPYDGYVDVNVPNNSDSESIKRAVFRRLKSTSFPEIHYNDITIKLFREKIR